MVERFNVEMYVLLSDACRIGERDEGAGAKSLSVQSNSRRAFLAWSSSPHFSTSCHDNRGNDTCHPRYILTALLNIGRLSQRHCRAAKAQGQGSSSSEHERDTPARVDEAQRVFINDRPQGA